MFNIRIFKEEDYPELVSWWKFWKFTPPSLEMLPESGIMISKEGVNICCGFLYFTNSKICWSEFINSNPNYRESDRKEAVKFLILELERVAKNKGFKVIFTSLKNPSLIKYYSDCEYIKGSSGTTEMIKVISD